MIYNCNFCYVSRLMPYLDLISVFVSLVNRDLLGSACVNLMNYCLSISISDLDVAFSACSSYFHVHSNLSLSDLITDVEN